MDILHTIAEQTRVRVEREREVVSLTRMRQDALKITEDREAKSGTRCFGFEEALAAEGLSFICECKKASPSKGLIAPDFPYLQIAHEYEKGGAAAISVLTEPEHFLGSTTYLRAIAAEVDIPVLRKDFIVDEYQIYQSAALGAQAVLLICSILDTDTLRAYRELCDTLGLSALVEAHDAEEIARAVAAGARIIGINNRDLHDFSVDFENSARLRALIPGGTITVAESGIKAAEDITMLNEQGFDAILVGEMLMRSEDRVRTLRELKEAAS